MGAPVGPPQLPLLLVGGFLLLHATLLLTLGTVARHASLNGALGLVYLAIACSAFSAQRSLPANERLPQRALFVVCGLLLGPIVLWWMFSRMNAQLARLATQDALTGVLNRNGLKQALQQHFAARRPAPMTWLAVDLDHFKRVNDTLGQADAAT